jgi:hypothetical protein
LGPARRFHDDSKQLGSNELNLCAKEMTMADLKIRVFKIGETQPETTVTIPGGILKIAANLIPKQAATALRDKGIDLDEVVRLSTTPGFSGTLVEIEDHKDKQRVVISVE